MFAPTKGLKPFSSKEVSNFPELLGTWTPSNSKTTEIGGLCAVPKLVDIGLMDREAKIGIFLGIQWDIGKMDRETNWWIWALWLFLKFSVGILLECAEFIEWCRA